MKFSRFLKKLPALFPIFVLPTNRKFKEDYGQAEKTIEKTNEIAKYEKKVRDASKSLKDEEEIYRVRRMTENIRRVSEYASDIAEIVLNMNIERTLKKTE